MRKILFLVAVMTTMSLGTQAQNKVGTMTIQPKGGFGLATLTNVDKAEMTGVGMFGGELEYALKERLSMGAGINFDMLGYGIDDVDGIKDWHTSLNYLAVPVVANYYIYKGLAVKAGLQPAYLLSAKTSYKHGGDKFDNKVTSDCNKFDLSIPIGISYEFSHVVIDARYLFGLTKVNKNGDKTCRNSVIMITTGYKFNL